MSPTTSQSTTARHGTLRGGRHHHVATEVPRAVKREVEALRLDGCEDARVGLFDRGADVWAITFTRDGDRKAILMWTVEVDV